MRGIAVFVPQVSRHSPLILATFPTNAIRKCKDLGIPYWALILSSGETNKYRNKSLDGSELSPAYGHKAKNGGELTLGLTNKWPRVRRALQD